MAIPTSPCHFDQQPARIEGNHWDGERYTRVHVCDACYDGGKLASKPRAPRKPRQQRQPVGGGDWNMLVAFTRGTNAPIRTR